MTEPQRKRRRGHGEGSVHLRGDGRWAGTVDLGWVDGKRKRKIVYGKTRREAMDRMAAVQRQLAQGLPLTDDRLTVGDYLASWVTTLTGTVRPSTEASYVVMVQRHIIPVLGPKRLAKLTPADVRAFLAAKAKEKSARGRPLSARTVQYIHAVLRRALEQARREEVVQRNVAALVSPPRVVRDEVVPLSPKEARRLLDAARGDRLFALYAVALAVGLRRGEALALRWVDIDFDAATLRVSGSLQRIGGALRVFEPKTPRSRRTVPLPPICVEALREHRERQLAERLTAPWWPHPELVFVTSIGTPIEPRNLARHFEQLCIKAGLRRVRFHDLRHTCASLLLAHGVEPRVIMETLGHSMIGTTLNLYAHVMPASQRQAAVRMHALLAGEDDPVAP